jgi:hypothetical protein
MVIRLQAKDAQGMLNSEIRAVDGKVVIFTGCPLSQSNWLLFTYIYVCN